MSLQLRFVKIDTSFSSSGLKQFTGMHMHHLLACISFLFIMFFMLNNRETQRYIDMPSEDLDKGFLNISPPPLSHLLKKITPPGIDRSSPRAALGSRAEGCISLG